jgi:hypothetical protein
VRQISTTLDEYVYTSDDEVVEGEIEAGRIYMEEDFNKIIEIKAREAHRVKLFMEQIDQREKTLVFCATQAHALAVRDLINQIKTSKDGTPIMPSPTPLPILETRTRYGQCSRDFRSGYIKRRYKKASTQNVMLKHNLHLLHLHIGSKRNLEIGPVLGVW